MTDLFLPSLFQVTEVELIYRNKVSPADRPEVNSVEKAYNLLMSVWDMNKIELVEQMRILLLDRKNRCIGISDISTGSISSCLCDPKVVFAIALKARASSLILSHNHPSGVAEPSRADIDLTKRMVSGGQMLDIHVLDHLIVTPRNFYSFATEGLMP